MTTSKVILLLKLLPCKPSTKGLETRWILVCFPQGLEISCSPKHPH